MKMTATQRRQTRLIRAVYPKGSDKRGYHVVLNMQNAKPFAAPQWSTKWASNLTPQILGGY